MLFEWCLSIKAADSTGRRNTLDYIGFKQVVESLCRRAPTECLSGPAIEGIRDGTEFIDPMLAEVRSFREVLTQETVGIFVAAALLGTLGIAEVNLEASVGAQLSMLSHLRTLIPGQ